MGWDPRETLAYDVAKYSFTSRASNPKKVQLIPLELHNLKSILNRPIEWRGTQMWCPISEAPQTTEFSISRFCVPFLTKGWALFCDCDIVCLHDIEKLFELCDDKYAVMVVKNQQQSGVDVHMVDQAMVYYERKNWTSVMLWNCDHPSNKNLTLEALNSWPGRDLHALKWLKDEEIGELPWEWNHLVDVNPDKPWEDIKLAHFTLGGPWLPGWAPMESDAYWYKELQNADLWDDSRLPKFTSPE